MPSNRFHITERPGRSAGYCVACNVASDQVYVFPLGTFILRLCRDCLAQFRQESGEVLEGECTHVWGTDGQHSNEYCKKCFVARPKP